jgi:hypothetical protein
VKFVTVDIVIVPKSEMVRAEQRGAAARASEGKQHEDE